jgi:hypothetical protein
LDARAWLAVFLSALAAAASAPYGHEPASSGRARASAGNCAPQAAAAPASSAARRPHEDATRSVAAAAGTARGCAHGVRNALALAVKSTAIEKLRMVNEGRGGKADLVIGGKTRW